MKFNEKKFWKVLVAIYSLLGAYVVSILLIKGYYFLSVVMFILIALVFLIKKAEIVSGG